MNSHPRPQKVAHKLNIAIAQSQGWSDCSVLELDACGLPPNTTSLTGRYELVPDYYNDLNACQQVVCSLSEIDYRKFCILLIKIVGNSEGAISAEAPQRALALYQLFNPTKPLTQNPTKDASRASDRILPQACLKRVPIQLESLLS